MTTVDKPDWLKAHLEANASSAGQRGWVPGQSGNPKGRPVGARNRKSVIADEFAKEGSEVARVVIEAALKGDMQAAKRLEVLERERVAVRTLGAWPVILGMDAWETLAMTHQEKLRSDTRGNEAVVTAESLPDPADVTHRYKPGCTMFGTRIRT